MSGYGIAGSHRSGKTTLARATALRLGFEYLEANVSKVIQDQGVSVKAELPFVERLQVQNEILKSLETKYSLMTKPFVTDRTPLDVLGYTLAEIGRTTLDPALREEVERHIAYGTSITAKYLRGVLLVRPIFGAPEAETSAPACPFYMMHVFASINEISMAVGEFLVGKTLVGLTDNMQHEPRLADMVNFVETVERQFNPKPEVKIWTPNS